MGIVSQPQLTLFDTASRNLVIHKIFIENDKKVRERLVSLIRKGIENGEIGKQINAEQAAFWLMTTVDGAIGKKGMESDFKGAENLDFLTYMIQKTFTS
ncbi:hypothetical protein [Xenorhabdus miraniensis]|uniref:TetR family transcriptional regulator n=1 Tax=Xenorhabdus miraniensis TaxID=351674 RepID=A0A2D0JPI4_9GAMM|nr:hypothetical protein [Xenorhabdus miraniensis]PHM48233.1 TetR family transcriptional regulator [Xenorhabdus miraniensis]